jgi:hypothetical protein
MNQGTRWVLLMQKIRLRKSHAWAPLRHQPLVSLSQGTIPKPAPLETPSPIQPLSRHHPQPVYLQIPALCLPSSRFQPTASTFTIPPYKNPVFSHDVIHFLDELLFHMLILLSNFFVINFSVIISACKG